MLTSAETSHVFVPNTDEPLTKDNNGRILSLFAGILGLGSEKCLHILVANVAGATDPMEP